MSWVIFGVLAFGVAVAALAFAAGIGYHKGQSDFLREYEEELAIDEAVQELNDEETLPR